MAQITDGTRWMRVPSSGLTIADGQYHYWGMWFYWPSAVGDHTNIFGAINATADTQSGVRLIHAVGDSVSPCYWAQASSGGAVVACNNGVSAGVSGDIPDTVTDSWCLLLAQCQLNYVASPTYAYTPTLYFWHNGTWYYTTTPGALATMTDHGNIDYVSYGAYTVNGTTGLAMANGPYFADAFLLDTDTPLTSDERDSLLTAVPQIALPDPSIVIGHWPLLSDYEAAYGSVEMTEMGGTATFNSEQPALIRTSGISTMRPSRLGAQSRVGQWRGRRPVRSV